MLKTGEENSTRFYSLKQHSFDIKHSYHLVRLINEVEQILTEGTLDLQRNREQLKSIRRGEWTLEQIEDYFTRREKELEIAYANSTLPHVPDEKRIRQLLMNCLEQHYGSLSDCVVDVDAATVALQEIAAVLRKVNY